MYVCNYMQLQGLRIRLNENNCNHILFPYSYSLYEPKSHPLIGFEKAILRDGELLSEVNGAFCKSHPLL